MKLEVFFDYTCPFCYLGVSYLNNLLPDYPNIEVEWHPCEAHPAKTDPRMELDESAGFWQKGILPSAKAENLPILFPKMPGAYSNLAIEGFFFLQDQGGDLLHYNTAVFEAVFVKNEYIEELDVVLACIQKAGGNVEKARVALTEHQYEKEQLAANEYAYLTHKVNAVPHYVAGEHVLPAKLGYGVTKEEVKSFLDSLEA